MLSLLLLELLFLLSEENTNAKNNYRLVEMQQRIFSVAILGTHSHLVNL